MKNLIILAALFVSGMTAADITGKWKGTAEGPNGTIERTFVFKQEGTKLTGETASEYAGQSTIDDGRAEGDNISFSIVAKFQGNEMKLSYKGRVTGDEMTLDVELPIGDGTKVTYAVKRVK